jgi:hypothetical protein
MNLDGAGVWSGRIDVDFFGDAIEIARLGVPVLAFAFVHGKLDGMAVGAVEGGVLVEDALNPIVAGGKIVKSGRGVAEGIIEDDSGLAGSEAVNVGAEDLLGVDFVFEDLLAGLGVVGGGDDGVYAAVEGRRTEIGTERDSEARLRGRFCGRSLRAGEENRERREQHERCK